MYRKLSLEGELITAHGLCRSLGEAFRIRVPPATSTGEASSLPSTSTSPVRPIGLPEIEACHVNHPSISPNILGERFAVFAQLVSLQIEFRFENDKLLL